MSSKPPKHCTYVGRLNNLRGRTALVQEIDPHSRVVLAQFDYPPDQQFDKNGAPVDATAVPECFGWHQFATVDFQCQ